MVPELTLLFVIEHSSIVTRFGYPFQTMGSGAFTKQFILSTLIVSISTKY